ncbi:hypothetical protein D3C79_960380 [compost metagenome]
MSQEAKIIALEHLVLVLLQELEARIGIDQGEMIGRALKSIHEGLYPHDQELKEAVAGALKDAASLIKSA